MPKNAYSTSSFCFFGLNGFRMPRFEERMKSSTRSRSGVRGICVSTTSQARE